MLGRVLYLTNLGQLAIVCLAIDLEIVVAWKVKRELSISKLDSHALRKENNNKKKERIQLGNGSMENGESACTM